VTHVSGFLFGRLYPQGSWMYFPAALLIKSSLTMLLLTLLAPVLFVRGLLPYRCELVFLGAGVLVFLGASMTSDLNIGVRHVLPVYPFAAVLAGACAWTIAKSSRSQCMPLRRRCCSKWSRRCAPIPITFHMPTRRSAGQTNRIGICGLER